MKLNKFKLPNTSVLISTIIVITAILTWLIPSGEFNRILKDGRTIVESGTFHSVASNPQGFFDVLKAPIKGFIGAAEIIGFLLIVGGAFSVLTKTEAINSSIKILVKAHHNSKTIRIFLIPIFMTIFSLGGAIFGMGEEVIPFIIIFVPMALALGYDSIVGVAIPFVGAGAGFAGAFINPFTIGIAQGIAELPILSGIEYRIIIWFITTLTAIFFVQRYALKIKKNPRLSPTYEIDLSKKSKLHIEHLEDKAKLDARHKFVLTVFLIGFSVMIFGVLKYEWFITEISAIFLLTGILCGLAGRLSLNDISVSFVEGAKDLIGTAIIIALARGILVIATDGKIIDPMLNEFSILVNSFSPIVSAQIMFVGQAFLNFFIPSGSGQAALTMPIMAPLSDLLGVSRQTAVLAFQFGDGFTNMIIPTSAITMGVLSLAEISWEKWARWILPLMVIFFILSFILLIPPFFFNW